MNNEKVKEKIRELIDDISQKTLQIRQRLGKEDDPSDELTKLSEQLDKTERKLQDKYTRLNADSNADWDSFEKNIYKGMDSFNDAYKRAGTLFRG